jgi:hypothetical protein
MQLWFRPANRGTCFPRFTSSRADPEKFQTEESYMSAIINKADAQKTVRDASADVAKSGGDVAAVGRKVAHDASQSTGETVRKVVESTSRDVARKSAEAAEQNLQKAAEDLRGTMGRPAEKAGNVADATRQVAGQVAGQMTGQAVEQLGQMSAMQDKASKELAGRTHQNLGVMMQTGNKLAEGYQSIMREWAEYTRKAMQCNIDGMNSIMRARTPQDLMAAQSELLNAELRVMLDSGVKISEATLRVARDAAESIGERTRQRNS